MDCRHLLANPHLPHRHLIIYLEKSVVPFNKRLNLCSGVLYDFETRKRRMSFIFRIIPASLLTTLALKVLENTAK